MTKITLTRYFRRGSKTDMVFKELYNIKDTKTHPVVSIFLPHQSRTLWKLLWHPYNHVDPLIQAVVIID